MFKRMNLKKKKMNKLLKLVNSIFSFFRIIGEILHRFEITSFILFIYCLLLTILTILAINLTLNNYHIQKSIVHAILELNKGNILNDFQCSVAYVDAVKYVIIESKKKILISYFFSIYILIKNQISKYIIFFQKFTLYQYF